MHRGGGLMVAPRSVRCVNNRTHIKQGLTVAIATASFVHYAYRKLTAAIRSVPLVVASSGEVLWQRERFGKAN